MPAPLLHAIKREANPRDVPDQSLIKVVLAERFAAALNLLIVIGVCADPLPKKHPVVGKFAERAVVDAHAHRPVVMANFLEMQ